MKPLFGINVTLFSQLFFHPLANNVIGSCPISCRVHFSGPKLFFFFSLEFSKPPIFDDPTPKKKKKKNLFLFVSFFFFLFYNLFFPTPPTYASSIDIPHMYVFPPDQCANCGSLGLYNLLLALPILTMASNSILDLQCPSWPVLLSVALLLPLDPWSLVVVSPRPSLPTS